MYRGYIKLWRRLKSSDLWLKESFTRGQAWVDLLMLANHSDGYIRKRGVRIDLKRGDVGWSERELADRWKWSRGKVRRFLDELCSEKESKLIPLNGPKSGPSKKNVTSHYHIKNYSTYQDTSTKDQPRNSTTDGPQTDHKRYQKNNDIGIIKNDQGATTDSDPKKAESGSLSMESLKPDALLDGDDRANPDEMKRASALLKKKYGAIGGVKAVE